MSKVIETSHLCRYFGEGELLVKALDDVSIDVEEGEFSAIIGPSGSGKSTLLHLIGGLDKPTHGEVILAGTNIESMTRSALSNFRRDHIGFVFQAYNLIPVLSTIENIEYVMLMQGVPSSERRKRVFEMLDILGLDGLGGGAQHSCLGGSSSALQLRGRWSPNLILFSQMSLLRIWIRKQGYHC